VEAAPGHKDQALIRAFLQAVRHPLDQGAVTAADSLHVCSGKRYRAGLLPAFIRPALISLLLIMVTSFKQRGCVAAVAFLGALSLSPAQPNPAPAPAQPSDTTKPPDHPPIV